MKEIGGYIELDTYRLPMLHESAIALNCGRNALAYLLRSRKVKRLWIPKLICDSVTGVCEREQVPYSLYDIGFDFLPSREIRPGEGEWLYFVNYYSQFDNEIINKIVREYQRVIVDNAQSYFQEPIPHVDTLYTCRKYFGVPDGAFLYTDALLEDELSVDESYGRMRFLLGRFEKGASAFYGEYVKNNAMFTNEPVRKMSRLTYNLLHGIDYAAIEEKRKEKFLYLHETLGKVNKLSLKAGSFMYPLMVGNGSSIRKKLRELNIYIPVLWPSVLKVTEKNNTEYAMAEDILPLPIDQRYGREEMSYLKMCVLKFTGLK